MQFASFAKVRLSGDWTRLHAASGDQCDSWERLAPAIAPAHRGSPFPGSAWL